MNKQGNSQGQKTWDKNKQTTTKKTSVFPKYKELRKWKSVKVSNEMYRKPNETYEIKTKVKAYFETLFLRIRII